MKQTLYLKSKIFNKGEEYYLSAKPVQIEGKIDYQCYFRKNEKKLFFSTPTFFNSVEEALAAGKDQDFEVEMDL